MTESIALVGGAVFDGTGSDLQQNTSILIEGTKIKELRPDGSDFDAGTQVIDVAGKTIIPGLIDCHNHLNPCMQWNIYNQKHHLSTYHAKINYYMRCMLSVGVTGLLDMGGLDAGFVKAKELGWLEGPRLQAAVVIIGPTNGLIDAGVPGLGSEITPQGVRAQPPGMPLTVCDGPWECRKKVREVLRSGADFIKTAGTGTPYDFPKLDPKRKLFTQEEMEAIVDEAHMAGVRVACHEMYSPEAALQSIEAGVDSIEHGTWLDEACVNEMVKRGTWLVPQFWIANYHVASNPNPNARAFNVEMLKEHKKSFRRALDAGVNIASGTDGIADLWCLHNEMQYMVEEGMTNHQALMSATGNAAKCAHMDDVAGTLAPGKEADLVVLDGNPLDDIRNTKSIRMVMQAGRAVNREPSAELSWQPLAFEADGWLLA